MSTTFRTAIIRTPGAPDKIEIVDVPVIEPGPGEVQIRIAAAAVNPVDLGVVAGRFHEMGLIHQPERTGLGWDSAGDRRREQPRRGPPGRRPGGGVRERLQHDFGTYAEHVVVSAHDVAVVPDGLDLGHGVDRAAQRAGGGAAPRPAR